MIRLLSFCMCILSLLGAFVFGDSKMPCLLVAVICAAVFIVSGKLMRKKLFALLITAGLAFGLLVSVTVNIGTVEGGASDYNDHLEKLANYIDKNEMKRASEEIDYLEEHFMQTDYLQNLKMLYFLKQNQKEEAMQAVENFENRRSRGYFEAKETCMLTDKENYTDDDFLYLYREAADANPDWAYANQAAGIYYAGRNDAKKAEYYLRVAYDCGELTYDVPFYLGIVCCEQGRLEEGVGFFEESFYLGAPQEYLDIMAQYVGRVE